MSRVNALRIGSKTTQPLILLRRKEGDNLILPTYSRAFPSSPLFPRTCLMSVYCYFIGFSRQESSFRPLAESRFTFPAKFCFATRENAKTSARRGCCLGNRQGARARTSVGSPGGGLSAPWSHRRRPEAPQEKEKGKRRGGSEKRWLTATLW